MRAFDFSRDSTGNNAVDASVIAAAVSDGMKLAIAGCWNGLNEYDGAAKSFADFRGVGIYTGAYTALTPAVSGHDAVTHARNSCGDEWTYLRFCAIDVEIPGVTSNQISDAIQCVVQYKQRPIIYTSAYMWHLVMQDATNFSWVPLWDAHYDSNPVLDFIDHGYGGWTIDKLVGDQYTNSTSYHGIAIDYDVFSDNWVLASPAPANPLDALRQAWIRDMNDLAVNASLLTAVPLATLPLALHCLYTDERNRAWQALLLGGK